MISFLPIVLPKVNDLLFSDFRVVTERLSGQKEAVLNAAPRLLRHSSATTRLRCRSLSPKS